MKQIIKEVKILDYAAEGKCLARVDDKILFVKNTAPGDVANILVTRKRKDFMEGRPLDFLKFSEERTEAFCHHFDYCGGCQWQHVSYARQLEFKQQQVIDQLQRIGKVEVKNVNTILGCEDDKYYRNKLEFSFSSAKWLTPDELSNPEVLKANGLGFHISGHFDKVLDIRECFLQDSLSNEIRNWTRSYAVENEIDFYELRKRNGTLRSITLRNTRKGNWMVILQFGADLNEKTEGLLKAMVGQFPQITSLYYIINKKVNDTYLDLETHLFHGKKYIIESIGDLNFRIKPKSFFQTNPVQAEKLYQTAADFCGDLSGKTVYDLYAGTGTIALFLAKKAEKVIGIESVDQAISDARWNAKENGISNAEFHCGDMRELLDEDFIAKHGKPDVIVTDPPRNGMHKDVVQTLINLAPERIVYISCKPSTQARDLAILNEKYEIGKIQPVDMFPHTHHVENIVQLNLRKDGLQQ